MVLQKFCVSLLFSIGDNSAISWNVIWQKIPYAWHQYIQPFLHKYFIRNVHPIYLNEGWICLDFWRNFRFFLRIFSSSNLPVVPLIFIIFVKSSCIHTKVWHDFLWLNNDFTAFSLNFLFCIYLVNELSSSPETPCCLY